MRVIEPPEFLIARDLQARYGVSRMWLEHQAKDHAFPQPIKFDGCVGALRHWRRATVLAWQIQWQKKSFNELVRSARPHQGAHNDVREKSA